MKPKHAQRLRRWMNPDTRMEHQMIRLTNLNGNYVCSVIIFDKSAISGSIKLTDISDISCIVWIDNGINEMLNSILSSCMILMNV